MGRRPPHNLSGQRFGRLLAQHFSGYKERRGASRVALWTCLCDCGRSVDIQANNLRSSNTKSCGSCLRERHGRAGTNLYTTWSKMLSRCHNPKDPTFRRYGARGISVCRRWRESFSAFLEDMGDKPSAAMSLDRIDNDGPYSKKNCRWATRKQQRRNSHQAVHWIEYNGERRPLWEWATVTGISYGTLVRRRRNGWPAERLLTEPPRVGKNQHSH